MEIPRYITDIVLFITAFKRAIADTALLQDSRMINELNFRNNIEVQSIYSNFAAKPRSH